MLKFLTNDKFSQQTTLVNIVKVTYFIGINELFKITIQILTDGPQFTWLLTKKLTVKMKPKLTIRKGNQALTIIILMHTSKINLISIVRWGKERL